MSRSTRSIVAFFIFITLLSSLKAGSVLGYYVVFTDNFIERYCENTTRPELQCEGKCALSKMLAQETQDNGKSLDLQYLISDTIFFLEPSVTIDFLNLTWKDEGPIGSLELYNIPLLAALTHPPQS